MKFMLITVTASFGPQVRLGRERFTRQWLHESKRGGP